MLMNKTEYHEKDYSTKYCNDILPKYHYRDYFDLDVLTRKDLSYLKCEICNFYCNKQLINSVINYTVCSECIALCLKPHQNKLMEKTTLSTLRFA